MISESEETKMKKFAPARYEEMFEVSVEKKGLIDRDCIVDICAVNEMDNRVNLIEF